MSIPNSLLIPSLYPSPLQSCRFHSLNLWVCSCFVNKFMCIISFLDSAYKGLVQFSRSVVSDSLQPHESQHARPLCPSPTPRVHPNSCPSSCDAIQPSHPLSSPSTSAPNPSEHQSFPMSQLFIWGGQSIGVSALASVFSKNIQDWSLLGWTGWISLQSKGLSRVVSNTTVQKHQFFGTQLSSQSNSHIHTWLLEKP